MRDNNDTFLVSMGGDSPRVSQWVLSHDFVFLHFLCMFLGVGRE